jgi:hypothetical protein
VSPSGDKIAFYGAGGYAHVVNGHCKSWAYDLKMNSPIRSLTFVDDRAVVSSGLDADVYWWDLRMTAKCLLRFAATVFFHL